MSGESHCQNDIQGILDPKIKMMVDKTLPYSCNSAFQTTSNTEGYDKYDFQVAIFSIKKLHELNYFPNYFYYFVNYFQETLIAIHVKVTFKEVIARN